MALELYDEIGNLSANSTYLVSKGKDVTISSNILPSGISLIFQGGILTINNSITLPPRVSLIFQGGNITLVNSLNPQDPPTTLTGDQTKIIAPITQIFDTPKEESIDGTWLIDRAYPQWFGAIAYSAVTTSSIDSAEAINKAIAMKQTGEVFIPRGHYRVNRTIEVKNGIKLIGESGWGDDRDNKNPSTVLVAGVSTDPEGGFIGNYFMRHNINETGNDWAISYPNPGTLIKSLFFANYLHQIANLKGLLSAGAVEIDNCHWRNFKQAYATLYNYTDHRKISRCAFDGTANSDTTTDLLYAFDINSLGDALIFEGNTVIHDPKSKGLHINYCNGGSINANVLNNDILIENSKAITFTSNHLENGAQLVIDDSNVTSMNNFFWKGVVPSMIVKTKNGGNNTPVVKSSGDLFLFYDKQFDTQTTSDVTNICEYDVKVDSRCSLEFSQTYRYWVLAGVIDMMNIYGIALCDTSLDDNDPPVPPNPITDFNEHSYLLSSESRIMRSLNVINATYLNNLLDPRVDGYGLNCYCVWHDSSGDYYYKYQILWDRTRLIVGRQGALSWYTTGLGYIRLTQNNKGALINVGNGGACGYQVMIRLYKGIDTNTEPNYTHYVDVPITGASMLYDNGISICGFKWKELSLVPAEDLLNTNVNTHITSIRYKGKNIECQATDAPKYGVWQDGDIVINTDTNKSTAFWIYLNGVWRSRGDEVRVTFYGNGGVTDNGKSTVTIKVTEGTLWGEIAKPEFHVVGKAKEHTGFTFGQEDDNTLVAPDFIIDCDLKVYASYSVLEIGFITRNGEILSADKWLSKYGATIFEPIVSGASFPVQLIDSHRGDLIEFMFFKTSDDKAYAFSAEFVDENGFNRGMDWTSLKSWGGNGLDMKSLMEGVGYSPFLVDSRYYDSKSTKICPFLVDPPNFSNQIVPQYLIDSIMEFDDTKNLCRAFRDSLQGIMDINGNFGSPLFDALYKMECGTIIPKGSFYISSIPQTKMIFECAAKIIPEITKLEEFCNTKGYFYGYKVSGNTIDYDGGVGFKFSVKYLAAGGFNLLIIPILVSNGLCLSSDVFGNGPTSRFLLYNSILDRIESMYISSSSYNKIAGVLITNGQFNYITIANVSHLF